MPVTHVPEILGLIASFLDERSLLQLRLVSRPLRQASLPAFADAWFREVGINFTIDNAEKLEFIAKNEVIRHYVRKVRATVTFGLRVWPADAQHLPGQGVDSNYHADFLSPGGHFISWAIRRFVRCTEMEIRDNYPYYMAHMVPAPAIPAVHVMYLMLSIFNYEDCPPIKTVSFDDNSFVSNHVGSAESILMLTAMTSAPSFRREWGSRVRRIVCQGPLDTPAVVYVSNMVQAAKNLESLELTVKYSASDRILSLLGFPTVSPMTHLSVARVTAEPETFADSIIRYRETLRSLDLSRLWLLPYDVETWSAFFGLLAETDFPCLTHFSAHELWIVSATGVEKAVHFNRLVGATDILSECNGRFESTAGIGRNALSGLRYEGSPESMRNCFWALSEGVSEPDEPIPEVDGPLPEAISSLAGAFGLLN